MAPRFLRATMILLIGTWLCVCVRADSTADQYRDIYLELDDGIGASIQLHGEILENSIRPPTCMEASFQRITGTLGKLEKTLQSEDCDWEVDMSAGLDADMSHLIMIRSFARIITGDARKAMAMDDSERVAIRIANMLRLMPHAGPDCLISSLIRTAILNVTNTLIMEADSRSLISISGARRILEAARTLDLDDPTHFRQALELERTISRSLMDDISGASGNDIAVNDAKLLEYRALLDFSELGDHPENWPEEFRDRIYDDIDRYWTDIFKVWRNRASPGFALTCDALDKKVDEGDYGPYMRVMGATLGNALKRTVEQNDVFKSDLDLLRSIESGTRTENQALNAAFLYTKIAMETQRDSKWKSNPVVRDEIMRLLNRAVQCDFSRFSNPEDLSTTLDEPVLLWTAPVVPWWLPAIDDVLGWVIENSHDAHLAKRDDDSTALLETAIHMIVHLCEDLNIASSVVAAERTGQVLDMIERWRIDGLSYEQASRLLAALREIPTGDPFGIRRACDQTRIRLSRHLENLAERNILSEQSLPSGSDALMYATAWTRDLPKYDLTMIDFDLDCQWPDGNSAAACHPIRQASIDSAALDGVQSREGWELDVVIPLEPSVSICENDPDTIIEATRTRLLSIRRSLRDQLTREKIIE